MQFKQSRAEQADQPGRAGRPARPLGRRCQPRPQGRITTSTQRSNSQQAYPAAWQNTVLAIFIWLWPPHSQFSRIAESPNRRGAHFGQIAESRGPVPRFGAFRPTLAADGVVNHVGPSGTAHGSSELVKAHTPRRGRPSCRNTANLRCHYEYPCLRPAGKAADQRPSWPGRSWWATLRGGL
jgi:hypothetical protein